MKLLLHICCGPCALYPFKQLNAKFDEVVGFYYNPNIHPPSEYKKRRDSLQKAQKKIGFEVVYPPYKIEEYFYKFFKNKENIAEGKIFLDRCRNCWELRLSQTAEFAKRNGFEAFTTTLLISPYQNHELVKKIGEDVGWDNGIEFYYEDFRKGFRDSQEEARKNDMYRQRYCGCVFSELERVRM